MTEEMDPAVDLNIGVVPDAIKNAMVEIRMVGGTEAHSVKARLWIFARCTGIRDAYKNKTVEQIESEPFYIDVQPDTCSFGRAREWKDEKEAEYEEAGLTPDAVHAKEMDESFGRILWALEFLKTNEEMASFPKNGRPTTMVSMHIPIEHKSLTYSGVPEWAEKFVFSIPVDPTFVERVQISDQLGSTSLRVLLFARYAQVIKVQRESAKIFKLRGVPFQTIEEIDASIKHIYFDAYAEPTRPHYAEAKVDWTDETVAATAAAPAALLANA